MLLKQKCMKEERGRKSVLDYKYDLSIIIPVYNTSQYLKKCLDSVVAAVNKCKNRKIEILIINDGSTDNSDEIIKEYCKKNSFMKRYYKENGGLSDVKNYGLERTGGKYVIFLDSDDYVEPDMYEEMLNKAEEEKADVVVCDLELVYDDASRNGYHSCTVPRDADMFAQVIDMTMMPASWNKIVKRELYDGLTFPKRKNNEDIAVTPIVLGRAKKIAVVHKAFYKYYQRTGSIQNSTFNEKRFVILETSKLCVDRIKIFDKEKQELIKGSVYLHQVLSLALYPIRREKFFTRYNMLKKYMTRVDELFPDIWDNFEIKEFVHWDAIWIQWSRRITVALLKAKKYYILSIFWTFCNVIYDFTQK